MLNASISRHPSQRKLEFRKETCYIVHVAVGIYSVVRVVVKRGRNHYIAIGLTIEELLVL